MNNGHRVLIPRGVDLQRAGLKKYTNVVEVLLLVQKFVVMTVWVRRGPITSRPSESHHRFDVSRNHERAVGWGIRMRTLIEAAQSLNSDGLRMYMLPGALPEAVFAPSYTMPPY